MVTLCPVVNEETRVPRSHPGVFTYLYQVEIHQGEYLDQGRAVTHQYSDYSHNVFDYQFSGSQFSGWWPRIYTEIDEVQLTNECHQH